MSLSAAAKPFQVHNVTELNLNRFAALEGTAVLLEVQNLYMSEPRSFKNMGRWQCPTNQILGWGSCPLPAYSTLKSQLAMKLKILLQKGDKFVKLLKTSVHGNVFIYYP